MAPHKQLSTHMSFVAESTLDELPGQADGAPHACAADESALDPSIRFGCVYITALIGYILPWGQMSFWGVSVITSLAGTIPVVGQQLSE